MASDKRIILITGANSGIGLDSAYAIAADSPKNHVIMCARSAAKGQQALKDTQFKSPAGTLSFLELDLNSDASIEAVVKELSSDFGRVDVLVNNAAICFKASLADTTREMLSSSFDTNVSGPALLTSRLIPLLQMSPDPRIVNVSTELGSIGKRTNTTDMHYNTREWEAYRLSKAALNMLTACQSAAYREWGCKVWSYCPGWVVTNLAGLEERKLKEKLGAGSAETSAKELLRIVNGDRDDEAHTFVKRYEGGYPW